jgi:hypothetical protein
MLFKVNVGQGLYQFYPRDNLSQNMEDYMQLNRILFKVLIKIILYE